MPPKLQVSKTHQNLIKFGEICGIAIHKDSQRTAKFLKENPLLSTLFNLINLKL